MTEAPQALLHDPMSVFAFLAGLVAAIFWLSGVPRLKRLFTYLPPVIFVYFLPMISTTLGITPPASAAYDFTTRYFLPVALFLLMISVDLKSVARLGPMALVMMSAGTVGIILGGPLALALFGHWLPSDAWQGFAALSGSWIGGTANMVAIAESVGTPPSAFNPVIVVDTVVGYGWMGVLLFFSVWQARFDAGTHARTRAIEETNARLAEMEGERHPTTVRDVAFLLGMGVGAAVVAVKLGASLPALGNPTIISGTTWAVLMVVTAGLLLSFTPLREYEKVGASQFGYTALYLLLAGIGAQADVKAVLQAPLYLAAGAVWIATHVVVLYAAARLVRAPLFFIATGSMANIGGPVSAPVVAGVYHPAMAPVGLLMAVVGYVFGVYGALLCAYLLGQVATLMGFV
jgi:uncharacterized membrane protein